MFEIEVTNNRASTKRGELLTKGQVGAQVQFTFNDHWTGMKKTAVFKRCGKTIDVMDSEWNGDIVTVPPEMTEEAGLLVHVGVYGFSDDGNRITPTLYVPLGAVALGADPNGDPSTDPTLPVWAQLQAQIGKDGTGIESITYKGEDEYGGNIYTVLLTDGTSYDITAPKGAKGDKGDTGAAGAPGKAATIQVGEVTTGAAGTPASVSNVGTDESAIFDFAIPRGDKGADGKTAYAYAVEGGYTGTETEFAAKLAEEMPTTLPNPNALTFTGAVTGSYDGSEPLKVEIPSGGGGVSLPLLYDLTTREEVDWIDTGDNAFLVKNFLFVEMVSVATATNESDGPGSASMYPELLSGAMQCPWNNQVVANQIPALMPKKYTKVFRAFCFRGDGGHWTSITSIRNDVNTASTTPDIVSVRFEGTTDQPMRGLIIGKAFAKNTNVFGVGSRLRVWGV